MPKDYEAMKEKFKKQGLSTKIAEQKAARIHNARAKPGETIVTRSGEGKKKRK